MDMVGNGQRSDDLDHVFAAGQQAADASAKFVADLWKDVQHLAQTASSKLETQAGDSIKQILECGKQVLAEAPKEADWTFAIDYTTDFGDGQGVESGWQMLTDFAAKTKGKNVVVVAQFAIPDTDEWDEHGPVVKSDTKYKLERYIIRNGEMHKAETCESKGYKDDLQGLVAFANKNAPAKRNGLIMDSHGTGNEGLLGDTGKISVPDFVDAIKNGLKDSGKSKMDIIDFDACLMAQNGAVNRIREIADQVVASSETESIYNGQNYIDPISRVLDKPDTDAKALARDIVVQTHKDMEEWKAEGYHPGVVTLSHLNLREYQGFRKSLEDFGDKLVDAMREPGNKKLIEEAIDDSKKYGGKGSIFGLFFGSKIDGRSRTDLKEFTEHVVRSIDNGTLKDPDRVLKKAAMDLLNKRSDLVDSYHGEGEYKDCGGLSVFLPARSLRNVDHEAKMTTSAGRLCEKTEQSNFAAINKDEKSRAKFIKEMNEEIFWTKPHFFILGVQGVDKEINAIEHRLNQFAKADDNEKRAHAFRLLHHASVDLASTPVFKEMKEQEQKKLEDGVSKIYKANMIEGASDGWDRFRLRLRQAN
jgi:hypothetical protein